uniref:Kinesin-like protein n=1 Tax=Clastoptera arizonana TaxID=38151 RepID=A0A1B6E462_9HEMI
MSKKSIKVYGRLKPVILNSPIKESLDYKIYRFPEENQEETLNDTLTITCKPVGYFINHKPKSHSFRFNQVFDQDTDQESIFEVVAKPVVDSFLSGYNGTVFAYGQTGSGKTFTISGIPDSPNQRGIIQRSVQYIFEAINKNIEKEFNVSLSYWEIHNENGYDLLGPLTRINHLEGLEKVILQENEKGDIYFRNLSLHMVSTYEEAMALLAAGDTNRMIAETSMNQSSSRSHCILTIHLVIQQSSESYEYNSAKLHLVDLAGSERVNKNGINGQNLVEACYINLSLHYLQQVIVALSEPNRSHVPYRNSIMTTALRDSLGGNCLTVMIANLAIDQDNIEETVTTCRFAKRVAMVKNQPLINVKKDPVKEVEFLKAKIKSLESQQTFSSTFINNWEEEIEECKNNCFFKNKLNNSLQNNINIDENLNKNYFEIRPDWKMRSSLGYTFDIEEMSQFICLLDKRQTSSLNKMNDLKVQLFLEAERNLQIVAENLYMIQHQMAS